MATKSLKEVFYGNIQTPAQIRDLIKESKEDSKSTIEHIIVFTNSKNPKTNITLKNIEDYLKDHSNIHLYKFQTDLVWGTESEDENTITISDGESELVINKDSNISNLNTIIFSRLSAQDNYDCRQVVQLLQDRGFLVLNPIRYSELASNKYETAQLLQKNDIPQPNFCLLSKSEIGDDKILLDNLKEVYPKLKKDQLLEKDVEYVVKILDGHGGTGVFLVDGSKIKAVLQTIFAIDKEVQLLVQKKEEADGGDIRVHVLTLRNKQVILGQMKRQKLGKDFRSNVSLGAEAVPIELTDYQKELALKVAKLSRLPWCAVDIMPLKEGSNPQFPDNNVILEINSSPGTGGISEVMGRNFIEILLENLQDASEFLLQNKICGYRESSALDFGNGVSKDYLSSMDTGNGSGVCTLEVGKFKDTGKELIFEVDGKKLKFKKEGEVTIHAGYEEYQRPYFILPQITIGNRKAVHIKMGIVEHRDNKSTNLLINREVLNLLGYIVHPNEKHMLTPEMEKAKII